MTIEYFHVQGILRTSISNCLTGRTRTSGGYSWKEISNVV